MEGSSHTCLGLLRNLQDSVQADQQGLCNLLHVDVEQGVDKGGFGRDQVTFQHLEDGCIVFAPPQDGHEVGQEALQCN